MDGPSFLAGIVTAFVLSALIGLAVCGFLTAGNRRERGK
jgi:hypothetical protein